MIPHNRTHFSDQDIQAATCVLKCGHIARGKVTKQLEETFSALLPEGKAVFTASGTAALYLSLLELGVEPGGEVAIPSYSCPALLDAVLMLRARPRPIDSQPMALTLSPARIAALPQKPEHCIAVNMFGERAPVEDIARQGITVVEDSCTSFGTRFGSALVRKESAATVFSFYATKVIGAGEGGLVWSPNRELCQRIKLRMEPAWNERSSMGFSFRPTDIEAALVLSQYERLASILERRTHIRARLCEAAAGLPLFEDSDDPSRIYYRFLLRASSSEAQQAIITSMLRQGVEANALIRPHELLHRLLGLPAQEFPEAEALSRQLVSIPCFPGLRDEELEKICEALHATAKILG